MRSFHIKSMVNPSFHLKEEIVLIQLNIPTKKNKPLPHISVEKKKHFLFLLLRLSQANLNREIRKNRKIGMNSIE